LQRFENATVGRVEVHAQHPAAKLTMMR
jgi:hypothetical protein